VAGSIPASALKYKIMNKEEMKETLVELIESGELTNFQLKYILTNLVVFALLILLYS